MKKSLFYAMLLILSSCRTATSQDDIYDLIISDVNIFNSITMQVDSNKTICIKGDTIAKIIDAKEVLKSKKYIDGQGKLLVPGFVDTHTHLNQLFGPGNDIPPKAISDIYLYKQELKEHFLKYGVTTILDLGQPESWLTVTTNWQSKQSLDYPNIYNAGSALISDYNWPPAPHHTEIYNKAHAAQKLKEYADLGVKHIKLYSWLKKVDIVNVLDEANKLSLIPFGHIDRSDVTINEGIDLGIKNFEHFFTLINGVLDVEEDWMALNRKYNLAKQVTIDEWTAKMILYFDYVATSPDLTKKLELLLDKLAASKSSISTTIHPLASVAEQTNFFSTFENNPRRSKPYLPSFKNLNKEHLKNGLNAMMNFLKLAYDKGIKIRIGTDCQFGGAAMMNELILLSRTGIPTLGVLQIATYNGAVAMGIDGKFGSIEEGKIADMVLFDKSPIDDYNNFDADKLVIKMGQIIEFKEPITKDLLSKMLNEGVDQGIKWYKNTKDDSKYYSDQKAHVIETAYELLKLRKVKESIAIFKFCQKEFPEYETSYNWIVEEQLETEAFIIKNEGEIDMAIELLEYMAELFPQSYNVYNSLGELYFEDEDFRNAKLNFKKSLELNPRDDRAKEMLMRMK